MLSFAMAFAIIASFTLAFAGAQPVNAQSKTRRDTSVNRQRRLAATMKETYTHKYEIGLGGSYLRAHSGDALRKTNLAGFAVTDTYYMSPRFGIVGDVRGYFGNARLYNNPYNVYNPLISEFTFMGGPQLRSYRKEKWDISEHLLGGVVLGHFSGGTKGLPPPLLGVYPDSIRAAISPGVNVDYNLFPNLAVRVTPNVVFTNFNGSLQTNLGVNAGFVYRFGRQK